MSLADSSRSQLVEGLSELVFGNEMLLDIILTFAIFNGGTTDIKTLQSCRLVRRRWLDRVCVAFQRTNYSPVILDSREETDKIIRFTKTFSGLSPSRIPSYQFSLYLGQSRSCNLAEAEFTRYVECLAGCGSRLVKFKLNILKQREAFSENFQPTLSSLELPNLQRIDLTKRGPLGKRMNQFIQWILDGCQRLTSFYLNDLECPSSEISLDLENLKNRKLHLPQTLTEISLGEWKITTCRWEALLSSNELPNLTSLSLCGLSTDVNIDYYDQIYSILNRFQQLSSVSVIDQSFCEIQTIRVPMMEHVENFSIFGVGCKFVGGVSPGLQTHLPSLKNITLREQDYEQLRQVMEGARALTVERVWVTMDGTHGDGTLPDESLLLQQMKRLYFAFPNVVQLKVTIPFTVEMSAMKLIFREMRQLTELDLDVDTHTWDIVMRGQHFLALLLGITVEEALTLMEQPHSWDMTRQVGASSIAHMKELRKLRLCATITNGDEINKTLVDSIFELTFLQMSNLQELTLDGLGSFKPSAQMTEMWKSQKRVLQMPGTSTLSDTHTTYPVF